LTFKYLKRLNHNIFKLLMRVSSLHLNFYHNFQPTFLILKKIRQTHTFSILSECLCGCVSPCQIFNFWTNLEGMLHKFPSSAHCLHGYHLLWLLWNGSAYTFPRQLKREKKEFLMRHVLCCLWCINAQSLGLSVYPLTVTRRWLCKHVPAAKKNCWRHP
jgi:hypothetical protein